MIAKFTIDRNDFVALQSDGIKSSKGHKIREIWFTILIIAIAFLVPLLIYKTIILALLWGLFYALLSPLLYKFFTTLKLRIMYKNSKEILKLNFVLGKCELTLSDEGLEKRNENGKEYAKWSQIIRASDDEDRYFLYVDDLNAIVIKKNPENMNIDETKQYQQLITEYLKLKWDNYKRPLRKQKKFIVPILITIIVIFLISQVYYQPQSDVTVASRKVNELFIENNRSNEIKASVNQKQIDEAIIAINKIDIDEESEYMAISMGLFMWVKEAQNELDARENKD